MIRTTREKSFEQEKRIASAIGGKMVIGSGSTPFLKGDVVVDNLLIEAKTRMEPCKTIQVKKAWLDTAKEQALATKKGNYAVAISFGERKDYFIIEDTYMLDLYQSREALMAVIDMLGELDNASVEDLDNITVSGIMQLIRRYIG